MGGQPGIERKRGEGAGGGRESEREREQLWNTLGKSRTGNKLSAASFSDVFSLVKWTLRTPAMDTRPLHL